MADGFFLSQCSMNLWNSWSSHQKKENHFHSTPVPPSYSFVHPFFCDECVPHCGLCNHQLGVCDLHIHGLHGGEHHGHNHHDDHHTLHGHGHGGHHTHGHHDAHDVHNHDLCSIDVKLNHHIFLFVFTFRYTSLFRNFFHNCSWFFHRNCVTMLCFHIPALLLWYCDRIFNRNTFTVLLGNMETFLNWYCFWNRMTFFSGHSITLLYWLR